MKNLIDSKNFKVPKNNSKLQEGCHLRKKIQSSKEKFKIQERKWHLRRKSIISQIQERFQTKMINKLFSKMDGFEWWVS